MPENTPSRTVPDAIAELNQWRDELAAITGSQSDFSFKWLERHGDKGGKRRTTAQLVKAFQARFAGKNAVQYPEALNRIRLRYDSWAKEHGIDTVSHELFDRFDAETGAATEEVDKITCSERSRELAEQIACRSMELSGTALELGCDDTVAAALKSFAKFMLDALEGRAALNNPTNWYEARLQANELLQGEAINGIPLVQAFDVALDKLAMVAGQKANPKAMSVEPTIPALTNSQCITLCAMKTFDASVLATSEMICSAIDPASRLSDETVRQCVNKLIDWGLAERPEGNRKGARLTNDGRRLAGKIAD